MPKLRAVLICERAIIEQGGMLSLITLIDEVKVQADAPPPTPEPGQRPVMVPHRFAVIQFWERADANEPEVFRSRSKLLTPSGKVFAQTETAVDLSKLTGARIVTQAPGFPWHGEGVYSAIVQAQRGEKWKTVGESKFRVILG
jgi:hypothetical protein